MSRKQRLLVWIYAALMVLTAFSGAMALVSLQAHDWGVMLGFLGPALAGGYALLAMFTRAVGLHREFWQ